MRDESHLTSDHQHIGDTLEHLRISITLQHHKRVTNNIFCSYRTFQSLEAEEERFIILSKTAL